jgi:predicted Zn-dependent protease
LTSSARSSDGSEKYGARAALTDAEKEWREAIHAQPSNPLLRIGLAETLGLGKRWREASNETEVAIRFGAQVSAAHAMLGASLTMRAYQEDRSPNGGPNRALLQQAAEELGRAVALAPKNCFLRSSLAITLIAERDFVRADNESDIAEKQCPFSTYTIWVGANSLAEQGNTNAAIVKLHAGLQKAPGCPFLWEYLSTLLMRQGDAHSARTVEEAGKKAPRPKGAACPTMLAN